MGKMQRRFCCAAFVLLTGCGAKEDVIELYGAARYAQDDCRRVALIDAHSGKALRGAEDFALDGEGKRLFVTAYDRRAVEKAARKNNDILPQGGIYEVSLDVLFSQQVKEISVTSLASAVDFTGGLHPHGLSFDATNHELIFINRTYEREHGRWTMTPRLQRIGANGEVFVGAPEAAHCAANDVAASREGVITSFDHASCGFGAKLENVFFLKRSGVERDSEPLFSKASFANGVLSHEDGRIVMAATREKALLVLNKTDDGYHEIARVSLPGGPDNLSFNSDGAVIAAVHPSTFALMLNRKFGVGKAPSRIVEANLETGDVEMLFDDPKGALFSAATVGVETESGFAAGSVTDEGLLVCQAEA